MLLDIRETVRNSKPLKYTLITLICIPFALVGIGSYFAGGAYPDVAEVDGVAINERQVDAAYNGLRGQYQQIFQGSAIPLSEDAIRSQALDGLVNDIVVQNTVEDQKFAVGDETLGRAIRNDQRFQVDGRFDSEVYQNHIQGSLSNVAAYEESLRANAALAQFRSGVEATSFQLPSESERLEHLSKQTRTIDFVRYSAEKVIENVEVSDEQITAYFDENADNYTFPERGKFAYIELKKSDLADEVEVSDDEIQAYYDDFQNDFVTEPEVRETSHIMLELEDTDDNDEVTRRTAELQAIKARIEGGEAFADVAKEVSDDIGSAQSGGSLGVLDPIYSGDQYVRGAQAISEEGSLSRVVKSQYGLHLIKLDKLAPAVITPFEEAREDIISQIKNNTADSEFSELRIAIEESVASDPDNLEIAADASNTELKTTDWVDVDNQPEPIFADPRVLSIAFSENVIESLNNSDLIEITPDHVMALRVVEHEEPRPKTLDDVRDEITDALKREEAEGTIGESAKAAVALMLKGTPVSKIAAEDSAAEATANEVLTRQSSVIDPSVVDEIYALAKPNPGKVLVKSASMQNGDVVAYALKAVGLPEEEVADDTGTDTAAEGEDTPITPPEATAQVFNPQLGRSEMAAVIANLREKADVTIEQ